MTQKQTEYFKKAYELKNITAAAEQLYVSRSALSYAIAELESEFNAALFTRTTTGIEPTEAADIFYEMIVRNENEMKLLIRRMQALNTKEKVKQLDIAVSITNDFTVVPLLYDGFIALHPELDVRIHDMPALDIPEAIYKGEVMVGICPADLRGYPQLGCQELYSVRMEIAIAGNHPLADRTALTKEDLAGLPLAVVDKLPDRLYSDLKNMMAPLGKEPRIVASLSDWSLVKSLVQKGYAAAYVPNNISREWKGVVTVPMLGTERVAVQKMIWSRDLPEGSPAWELIGFVREAFRKTSL